MKFTSRDIITKMNDKSEINFNRELRNKSPFFIIPIIHKKNCFINFYKFLFINAHTLLKRLPRIELIYKVPVYKSGIFGGSI